MSRGAPGAWSRLTLPNRAIRPASAAACPECHDVVPTRDGRLAGHYAVGSQLCTGSSTPVPTEPPTRGAA